MGKPHVAYNSGNMEWYTPPEYVDAVRKTMGVIDVDPASSDKAQEIVKAERYFTAEDDGLTKAWYGNVFLNPPYKARLIDKFCEKVVSEYRTGRTLQAIVLVNNSTESKWFKNLTSVASAICFPESRIRYISPEGVKKRPLQGQAFIYMGAWSDDFIRHFNKFGWCAKIKKGA